MKPALRCLCWGVPPLLLALHVLAWLRYGTDLPYLDDWHPYLDQRADSLDLAYLFSSLNNTISPVGRALDALVQRGLGGHVVLHQLLSMLAILGGLLVLQARLLTWAVPDSDTRALAFLTPGWMLQPYTYWGEQVVAYHQGLPVLFLFAAFAAAFLTTWATAPVVMVTFVLGLLASLSYISGAVAALSAGVTLWVWAAWRRSSETAARMRWAGWGLTLAGVLGTAIQVYKTRIAPDDLVSQHLPLTWPSHPDFWPYLLGKLGRAMGRFSGHVAREQAIAGALLVLLVLGVVLLLRSAKENERADSARVGAIYLPVLVMVAIYLAVVTMGRVGFRPPGVAGFRGVFTFGYERFHFFWVTLLLPWLVASLMTRPSRLGFSNGRLAVAGWGLLVVAIIAGMGWRGVFDISDYYAAQSVRRAEEIRCLQAELGAPTTRCETIPGKRDFFPVYAYARRIQASFVKYFPMVEQDPPRQWLWRLPSEVDRARLRWQGRQPQPHGWLSGQGRATLEVDPAGEPSAYARCAVLGVQARLRSQGNARLRVFTRPKGTTGFESRLARGRSVPVHEDGEPAELHFVFDQSGGFEPALRLSAELDAGARLQLVELRTYCRLSTP